ncbi:MAG: glycosyltransferase [Deltaproteobacteria bacterium]|nr:MAG: glycosyltransferase [Deltaproteobacteria bacterium]
MIEISVIIPVRNEEKNIPELSRRLQKVFNSLSLNYEVIFVTDINTDNTLNVLEAANKENSCIKTIKLSTGYGHHIAVLAGLHQCCGNSIVIMDGDLQDLPEDIPLLLNKINEGYDVVYGVKEKKNESAFRNFLSKSFIKVMKALSDYDMSYNTCMFRVISKRVVDEIRKFNEREPSITAMISLIGFPSAEVLVQSGKRLAGETNYSLLRQINFAISFLLSFSTKPLRIISFVGLCISGLSMLYFIFVIIQAVFFGVPVTGWPTLVTIVCFLGGMTLLAQGITGEYIARIFMETKRRPLYVIENKIGFEK